MCARIGSASELNAASQPRGRCFGGVGGVVVTSEGLACVLDIEAYDNRSPLLARSTETEAAGSCPVALGAVIAKRTPAVTKTKPATTMTPLKYADVTRIDLLQVAKVAFATSVP